MNSHRSGQRSGRDKAVGTCRLLNPFERGVEFRTMPVSSFGGRRKLEHARLDCAKIHLVTSDWAQDEAQHGRRGR
jgi:hypothetical protein